MIKKLVICVLAILLVAPPAFGGNDPEFDAVGCDSTNFFNDWIKMNVVCCNITPDGKIVNDYSDWVGDGDCKTTGDKDELVNGVCVYEEFYTSAGMLFPDPCFDGAIIGHDYLGYPIFGEYDSALTDAFNEGIYRWRIILQKKPESDLNVNIRDCVLKHNEFDWCWSAEQTGRYFDPGLGRFFVPTANPKITVKAYPGPYATPGFTDPILLDARQMPGLGLICLDNACYTSKALWEEGLVVAMPQTGLTNSCGETTYNLKQGDAIEITVAIPSNNTVDLYYGPDNIIVKYIGIKNTYFINTHEEPCSETNCYYLPVGGAPDCGVPGQPACG